MPHIKYVNNVLMVAIFTMYVNKLVQNIVKTEKSKTQMKVVETINPASGNLSLAKQYVR